MNLITLNFIKVVYLLLISIRGFYSNYAIYKVYWGVDKI